ncbi:DUF1054 domain-containing protein [Bacillus timonensis]|nr:DUF1054 domain-containing protein [Bacillus timonensis]
MNKYKFSKEDFDVFLIDGLEERMAELIRTIRPKLEALGEYFAPTLSNISGDEMFVHVAKHARRTINPPKDTWVAFANNKRGYKMLPHFQIGLWESHVFVWFAIIYEAPIKAEYGKKLTQHFANIKAEIPDHFVWSIDHMKPEATPQHHLTDEELLSMFNRLQTVKKSEILCGVHLSKEDVVKMSEEEFLSIIESTFKAVLPLYHLSRETITT